MYCLVMHQVGCPYHPYHPLPQSNEKRPENIGYMDRRREGKRRSTGKKKVQVDLQDPPAQNGRRTNSGRPAAAKTQKMNGTLRKAQKMMSSPDIVHSRKYYKSESLCLQLSTIVYMSLSIYVPSHLPTHLPTVSISRLSIIYLAFIYCLSIGIYRLSILFIYLSTCFLYLYWSIFIYLVQLYLLTYLVYPIFIIIIYHYFNLIHLILQLFVHMTVCQNGCSWFG